MGGQGEGLGGDAAVIVLPAALPVGGEGAVPLEAGAGSDATIACVAEARAALSSLLGLDAAEDLLDKVFGSFCVGK